MNPHWPRLIAFTGLSGAGKDTAAEPLAAAGYIRHNFGDLIKRELDTLISRHFQCSAFTEHRPDKERFRRTLEAWGEDNYHRLQAEYFRLIDHTPSNYVRIVNTRLVRVEEAKAWRERGGVLIEIHRPGLEPATEREAEWRWRIMPHTDAVVSNDGTPEVLHNRLFQWLDRWGANAAKTTQAPAASVQANVDGEGLRGGPSGPSDLVPSP